MLRKLVPAGAFIFRCFFHIQGSAFQVVTVLLDQKQPATNGFDVMKGDLGGIFIAHVKEDGPAYNKLSKGDDTHSAKLS